MFVDAAPAVDGLGAAGGFSCRCRTAQAKASRRSTVPSGVSSASSTPTRPAASVSPYSTYDINVPSCLPTSTTRAKQMGVPLRDIYDAADQPRLALSSTTSAAGKTYRVIVQADARFRADAALSPR